MVLFVSLRALRLDSRTSSLHLCRHKCLKRMYIIYDRVFAFLISVQEFFVVISQLKDSN